MSYQENIGCTSRKTNLDFASDKIVNQGEGARIDRAVEMYKGMCKGRESKEEQTAG